MRTNLISTAVAAALASALAGGPGAGADAPSADRAARPIAPWRATDIDALRIGFAAPPREAGPWVFWFFFENVMSKGEITRQLEEMAAAGIAGAEMRFVSMRGFAEGKPGPWFDPEGWARLGQKRLEFLSDEFIDAIAHACEEARRLGLHLAISTGMGWPAGGPWVTPQHRSKHLAWTAREISGPEVFEEGGLPPDSLVLAWQLEPEGAGKAVVAGSFRSLADRIRWQDDVGSIRWDVPEGRWLIGTFRVTPGGLCDKGNGPEVDPGSREAMLFHLDHVFGRLDPRLRPFYGTTLVDVTTDSWEYERGGNRFWTPGIVDAFVRAKGYDLRERMHALLGYGPRTEQLVADLEAVERAMVRENCFETITRFLNARGLRHRAQVRGRGLDRDFFEVFAETDVPEVEEEVHLPEAVWTAHLLGRPIVSAEAFTFLSGFGRNLERDGQQRLHEGPLADPRRQWETTPAQLRWHANAHFARGVNRLVGGLIGYSPPGVPPPGWRMYAEVHLGRDEPWWPFMPAYTAWARRMQWVLQAGGPVADALVYPVRANPADGPYNQAADQPAAALDAVDAASPYLLGRLAMRGGESPYDFDRLVLLDDVTAPDEARRILDLVERGAILVCCRAMPAEWSAFRFPKAAALLPAFRAALEDGRVVDARTLGWRRALDDARSVRWLPKSANLSFVHRRVAGGEVYMLANWGPAFVGEVSFPHADLGPEIWNADTGTCLPAGQYRVGEGRTAVKLELEPHESACVVFTSATSALHAVRCAGGRVTHEPDGRLCTQVDTSGTCRVELSDGRAIDVRATLPPPIALDAGWTLAADPARGFGLAMPLKIELERLGSWRSIPALRTYAGVARYETALQLGAEWLRDDVGIVLDLGAVHEVADVWANDRRVGTSWFPPHAIDLTGHVREGRNDLRIDVVNILKNHLDAGDAYARPSGLMGPVRIRPVGRFDLRPATP